METQKKKKTAQLKDSRKKKHPLATGLELIETESQPGESGDAKPVGVIDSALMLAVKGERTHVLSGGNVLSFWRITTETSQIVSQAV